jgi:hypothetical protein
MDDATRHDLIQHSGATMAEVSEEIEQKGLGLFPSSDAA